MSKPPDGATLSDDGYYWWDGTEWQQVDSGDGSAAEASSGSDAGDTGSAEPTAAGGEDEEVAVRVEASLEEEPVELTLDELLAEGFTPDETMA